MKLLNCAIALALLAGCPGVEPVRPEPKPEPVEPHPIDPTDPWEPEPAPTATPCERACGAILRDGCAATPLDTCVDTCARYEDEAVTQGAPGLSWNPECIAKATGCKAIEACRARP